MRAARLHEKPQAGSRRTAGTAISVNSCSRTNTVQSQETIVLRYQDGLFLPVPGVANLDKAARDAQAADIFVTLLRRFTRERPCGSRQTGYELRARHVFAKEGEAIEAGLSAARTLPLPCANYSKPRKSGTSPIVRPSPPELSDRDQGWGA